jgi:hypothetical protein
VYKHVHSVVMMLCNEANLDRTISSEEVRRSIDELKSDCGSDGAFSGMHFSGAGLRLSVYSIYGGSNLNVPTVQDSPMTDITPREAGDPCEYIGFDGQPRYDCMKPEGHTLNEDGSCGKPAVENKCEVYCETKRTGFLGVETPAPGKWANSQGPSVKVVIAEGAETYISKGFSIGVEVRTLMLLAPV